VASSCWQSRSRASSGTTEPEWWVILKSTAATVQRELAPFLARTAAGAAPGCANYPGKGPIDEAR
jgi:hypothetical protein